MSNMDNEINSDIEIVKPPNDNKSYRYIVLENGLRVLLLSDINHRDLLDDSDSSNPINNDPVDDQIGETVTYSKSENEEIPKEMNNDSNHIIMPKKSSNSLVNDKTIGFKRSSSNRYISNNKSRYNPSMRIYSPRSRYLPMSRHQYRSTRSRLSEISFKSNTLTSGYGDKSKNKSTGIKMKACDLFKKIDPPSNTLSKKRKHDPPVIGKNNNKKRKTSLTKYIQEEIIKIKRNRMNYKPPCRNCNCNKKQPYKNPSLGVYQPRKAINKRKLKDNNNSKRSGPFKRSDFNSNKSNSNDIDNFTSNHMIVNNLQKKKSSKVYNKTSTSKMNTTADIMGPGESLLEKILESKRKIVATSVDHNVDSENTGLSSAALTIGVGSFSDPEHLPGLAHFLEHMVFMGSEAYPMENDFDAYVKKYGGCSNAYTEVEKTTFYFDIQQNKFKAAMDRFSNFFICPLLQKSSLEKEIEAVDSEFLICQQSDSHRKESILAKAAVDGHPMGKFMWGNKTSLKCNSRPDINIHEEVMNFHNMYYTAQFMTLCVNSREPLDVIEAMVTNYFGGIQNNGLKMVPYKNGRNKYNILKPFDNSKFFKMYRVTPIKTTHQIDITFALPSQRSQYRVKPLAYMGWIIGHEGPGSILSALKKRLWATALSAGNSDSGWEHNISWANFSIGIVMTDEGLHNLKEVIKIVFDYLQMMKKEGPQKAIYNQMKRIEQNMFRFLDQSDITENADNLSCNMRFYPISDIVSGPHLYVRFRRSVIERCMEELTPRRANYMLISKSNELKCNLVDNHFNTKYSVEDVHEDWYKYFEGKPTTLDIHLPRSNKYIAMNFDIKKSGKEFSTHTRLQLGDRYPVLIIDDDQGNLYYVNDNSFNSPKANINFILESPAIRESPLSVCVSELYLRILNHDIGLVSYAADAAQLHHSIGINEVGMMIHIDGFSDKLIKLFERIIRFITDFHISEEKFTLMKSNLRKAYLNSYIKPSRLSMDLGSSLLQIPHWTTNEKVKLVDGITKGMLYNMAGKITTAVFIKGLVQGNITHDEAIGMYTYMMSMLRTVPINISKVPEFRVPRLPKGETVIRCKNANNFDCTSDIHNYYQMGTGSLRDHTLNQLITMNMDEPLFDILRTREQLGYTVFANPMNNNGVVGISVQVVFSATKFTMKEVDDKMEDFLLEYEQILKELVNNDFETMINTMIINKRCDDGHLNEETCRNWNEIIHGRANFKYLNQQCAILKTIVPEEVLFHYSKVLPRHNQYRKLSIQIEGHKNGDSSSMDEDLSRSRLDDTMETCNLVLVDLNQGRKKRNYNVHTKATRHVVTDIHSFRKSLPVYDVHQVV